MDFYQEKELRKYQIQLICLFIIVIVIAIVFYILLSLISLKKNKSKEYFIKNDILKKGRIVVVIILCISIYFLFLAYDKYRQIPNKTNFLFLCATMLVIISSLIKLYTLYQQGVEISGVEDVLF
jgi:membrane protease YdiL (CAAX protease family)